MHIETGTLTPVAPFDFEQSLKFLGTFGPMKNEQTVVPREFTKATCIDSQTVVFQLTSSGNVEEPRLEYVLFSLQSIHESIKEATVERISSFLSLMDDLELFYHLAHQDPEFLPIIEFLYGYHQVKFLTPFEAACWSILTQRNPMTIAQKMKHALSKRFGTSLEVHGLNYWAFPEPIDDEP